MAIDPVGWKIMRGLVAVPTIGVCLFAGCDRDHGPASSHAAARMQAAPASAMAPAPVVAELGPIDTLKTLREWRNWQTRRT